jgi:acyl-CoA synthetase (AMP-forming)/AMP-acid ligase II
MRGVLVQDRYWGEQRGPYSADGWAHLGDLGFVDADGYLHIVGRTKDIIIRGGTNLNPYELESILRSHYQIVDACVVGRSHPELGEVPIAFLILKPGAELDFEGVNDYLRSQGVASYKQLASVFVLKELPLSGPGKVNRKSLRELGGSLVMKGENAFTQQ